jgi:hypothetical protein
MISMVKSRNNIYFPDMWAAGREEELCHGME